MIALIVAMDQNNLIGYQNKLPWHISNDLKHFKNTTKNGIILMGHNTYVNLKNKLSNKKICVYSNDKNIEAWKVINNLEDLDEFVDIYKNSAEELFISGGKFIYEKYYKIAELIIISRINGEYVGDTYLNLDLENYSLKKITKQQNFNIEWWEKKTENPS